MSDMFCFQCQQTAGNKCCVKVGVCGKQPSTANLQDNLIIELIKLSEVVKNSKSSKLTDELIVDGLFITLTNVNFDNSYIEKFIQKIITERKKYLKMII